MMQDKKSEKEVDVEFLEDKHEERTHESLTDKSSEIQHDESNKKGIKIKPEKKKLKDSLRLKYENLNEQFLRLRAEFANYKKRVEKEQSDYLLFIRGEIIKNILPALDDFDHMFEKSEGENNETSILEGVKLIYEKLIQVLKDNGIEKIEAIGKDFDPQIHEALLMQKTLNKNENGKVINVFQAGYTIKGKLLRPSKVIVGEYDESLEKD
jgi:molecular chaperone GrpE